MTILKTSDGKILRSANGKILRIDIPVVTPVNYGLLYNWYAATDARNIASNGWHVPTVTDWDNLNKYLSPTANVQFGNDNTSSHKLRETGIVFWNTPNTGATNETKFNGRANGMRNDNGAYSSLTGTSRMWSATSQSSINAHRCDMITSDPLLYTSWWNTLFSVWQVIYANNKKIGAAIRFLKDSTILTHGQTGTYIDPSGYVYRTICIGTQEWVADNIKTQHYRNGDAIPEVTDNTAWAALTTGALCAYNNDWSNV